MNRNDELEFLKIDLNNIIQGMTICEALLSDEEKDHLNLHRRCLSILERIKVSKSESDAK